MRQLSIPATELQEYIAAKGGILTIGIFYVIYG
jgi:hypothetical protein